MRDKKGSIWRKWDLHFHTPSSYDYKDKSVTNQDIIDGLVVSGIKVVAVTDHHLIDIPRIKHLQELGKGQITILPGIEFLSELRGEEPLHFIGLFSEDCNLEHVWGQIKNLTSIKDIIGADKKHNEIYCDLLDTSNLITQLGGIISIHAGTKHNGIENITHSLAHGLALKKDIAQAVNIFELGSEKDVNGYLAHVIPFLQANINKNLPLIICSDNHNIRNYSHKQSLWIKGDPNFATLKQLLIQPDRAYIGTKPPSLQVVESNPTKYVDNLKIYKKLDSDFDEVWFNKVEIALNSGLVAIIGNKGNGKSALTDILGLCGNTHNHSGFSFLNQQKFLKNKNEKADNFEATLTWNNGKSVTNCLSSVIDINQEERIKYIPQSYLEKLCVTIEGGDFENELKSIIFSHIPQSERLSKNNLDELISHKTQVFRKDIEDIKSKIAIVNNDILFLEEKENPAFVIKLEESLALKQEELDSHEQSKPLFQDQPTPVSGGNYDVVRHAIQALGFENEQINIQINSANSETSVLNKDVEIVGQRKHTFDSLANNLRKSKDESKTMLVEYGIDPEQVFTYQIDTTPITKLINAKNDRINELNSILSPNGEKLVRQTSISHELADLQNQLDQPAKIYQEYLGRLNSWNLARQDIIGSSDIEGSLSNIEMSIKYVKNTLKTDLKEQFLKRKQLVQEIFNKKNSILNIYKELYNSVTAFILQHDQLMDSYKISFDTHLKEKDLFKRFENFINFNSKGSFYGVSEGLGRLRTCWGIS